MGYPNPSLSHFRATDIWMSGSDTDEYFPSGWAGRYLQSLHPAFPDGYPNPDNPDPLAIQILEGRVHNGEHLLVDALGGLPEAIVRAQELAQLAPDPTAPLLLMRGGRVPLPPQPFPPDPSDLAALIGEALRPRVLALLPFIGEV